VRVLERGMRGLTALLVLGAVIGGGSQDIASAQEATPVPTSSESPSGMGALDSAAGEVSSAQQQLADRYAPITMLRTQSSDCDKEGEGYFPSPVDFIFDNPDIVLKAVTEGDPTEDVVISAGLTPQELATAGPNTYVDFPGNPRDPGCTFEEYFKRMVDEYGLEPTTYVRFVTDEAEQKLYVEYWFWYLFNDWNNTHETDWEMVYVVFDTTSV
jgi:hypothetical protein